MSTSIETMKEVFALNFDRLETELKAYENESDLWLLKPGIGNSAGTLALHLCGNAQHFFGAMIGETGYVRDREAEFARRNVPLKEILEEIKAAEKAFEAGMSKLTEEQLSRPFPVEVFGHPMTYTFFLLRLLGHFDYHLGQINYHRRLI
ncbi:MULTISPECIES: DinB family protein [Reichenbachiella]|uniref:DinB family protein n=1 Tax=Reichenbachiella TaxID=156993 RepID=UPI000ED206F9|nr:MULTISPECIES: DinB family protein [Reichenbachiella]RJE71415.1 DinB superfamily protein [Reichenbachiella sp. MSK19-1]